MTCKVEKTQSKAMPDLIPPSVVVRVAETTDAPTLLRLIADLQNFERAMHDTRVVSSPSFARAYLHQVEQRTSTGAGIIVVAEGRGSADIVGFGAGWIETVEDVAEIEDSNVFGYISDLYVVPDRRGKRIAGLILTALEEHLSSSGVTRLRIASLAENAAALASYRRHGFGPYEVILEKRIGPTERGD